ncbi:MAG: hypothetical protein ACXVDE_09695, partial [Tumebacillaceae bacterium]
VMTITTEPDASVVVTIGGVQSIYYADDTGSVQANIGPQPKKEKIQVYAVDRSNNKGHVKEITVL